MLNRSAPILQSRRLSCSIGAPQSSNRGAPIISSGRPNHLIGAPQLINRGAPTHQSGRPNDPIEAPQPINRGAPVEIQVATDSDPDLHYAAADLTKDTIPYQDPARVDDYIFQLAEHHQVKLRGREVILNRQPSGLVFHGVANYYDQTPEFHHPTQIVEAKNYDKDNFFTWSEYTDAHLIKPIPDGTMAMWLTKEATYVAVATEMNWRREFFGRYGNNILIDNAGHQYKCKGVMDYPSIPYFWVQGYSGDYFAIVLIFEPLPLNLDTITYIVPEGEPFKANFASWSGDVKANLSIKELRDNQKLFEYFPRKIVE